MTYLMDDARQRTRMAKVLNGPKINIGDALPQVAATFPVKLHPPTGESPLFGGNRYVILYGGRGGGKSWAIARSLIIRAAEKKLRIVCAREYQSSIKESVHQLLCDQIVNLKLDSFFNTGEKEITGINGSTFRFVGLRQNIDNIRSFEGTDIIWLEEASNISADSYDVLIPTIRRKQGSQVIISFNPDDQDDATWKRYVIDPPKGACVVKVNWQDNEFLNADFIEEINEFKEKFPEEYPHVYLGECRKALSGAVYGEQLAKMDAELRVTSVRYDPFGGPVEAFWDLGFSDKTAIWIAQVVKTGANTEIHVIGYLEGEQKELDYYLFKLSDKSHFPFIISKHWLPHDAKAQSLGTGKSIEEIMRGKMYQVQIVPKLSLELGIMAVRQTFPQLWFDSTKCAEGLKALRKYRYEARDRNNKYEGGLKDRPKHDWTSHASDALRYMCLALRPPGNDHDPEEEAKAAWADWQGQREANTAWMNW